jgi:hypothetical protein
MVHHNPILAHTRNPGTMLGSSVGSSTHAKLHKRANSGGSLQPMSPLSVISSPEAARSFGRPNASSPTAYVDVWSDVATSPNSANKGLKIKPYLRKFSARDNTTIDLNRPAAENEGLAGLGIDDPYSPRSYRSASEVPFSPMGGRQRHHRSTSNNSQFSTTSSLQRPSAAYKHPMRQTPRPYTPPTAKSYPNSTFESEDDVRHEVDDIMSEEEFRYRQHIFDPSRRSGSLSSATAPSVPALTIHTSGSFTKLGSYSQTSLTMNSPTTRPRGDTVRSFESTASPVSRASFDKAFSFLRVGTGRDSPIDPATRAREIHAARLAYREREEAKERKAEKEALRQADRETRKKSRHDDRLRRKSDTYSRSASLSNEKLDRGGSGGGGGGGGGGGASGKDSPHVAGKQYSDYAPAHEMSMPARVDTDHGEHRTEATPDVSRTRAAKSTWLAFITWFRTRLLRLGRRMSKE